MKRSSSDIMRRVGSKDTAPELALRRILRAMGLRYRIHSRDLAGRILLFLARGSLSSSTAISGMVASGCAVGLRQSRSSFTERIVNTG